jgi:hypothetical protein
MEVSRKKGFRLSKGSAEGEADYFTKIVYHSSVRVVNKSYLEAGEKLEWPRNPACVQKGNLLIALGIETTIRDIRIK